MGKYILLLHLTIFYGYSLELPWNCLSKAVPTSTHKIWSGAILSEAVPKYMLVQK